MKSLAFSFPTPPRIDFVVVGWATMAIWGSPELFFPVWGFDNRNATEMQPKWTASGLEEENRRSMFICRKKHPISPFL